MRSVAFEAGRDRSTWLSRFLDRRPGWVDRLNEELRKRVAEAADATGTSGRIRRWGWSALLFLASWLRRRALLVFGALIMAVVIAVVAANAEPRYFQVDRNVYVAVAGLFIAALAVERFTELTVAPWVGRGDRAVDRSILVGSAGLVFGVALAAMIGLDGLEVLAQIGQEETSTVGRDDAAVTRTIGLLVAGLAIAGGTKPLHDLISRLERNVQDEQKAAADKKSDETPPSGAGTRRYPIGLDIEVPKWRSLAKKPVDLDDAPAAEPGAQPTGDQDDQPTEAQIAAANATMEEVLKILPGWELSDSRDGTVRALAYVDVSPGTAEHRRQSFTAAHRVQSQRGLQVTAVSVPPEGPLEGEENPPPR